MKITVFTSNQPRHISLINTLSEIADEVYAVMETNTVFPGKVNDFFKKSETMQAYFERVIESEQRIFGKVSFLPPKARPMVIKMGDLNRLPIETLKSALNSDLYIVFGASYIKGELCQFLVDHKAYNIHMGISPYYRGSSCNFWALYDRNPHLLGATIHYLTKGLDSGPILFHALPEPEPDDPFLMAMKSVKCAHYGLRDYIKSGRLFQLKPVTQDKSRQVRYTKNADFTDEIAQNYLNNPPTTDEIKEKLKLRTESLYIDPYFL